MMHDKHDYRLFRSAVRRNHADVYLLAFLVSFAATVIGTRAFLELTGYPQIGNGVLHVAHALWGGLLLLVAALLPLAFSNRWALQTSAMVGGAGAGLFVDEVGKFITQANDYFFPPALSIIYGVFLLTVLVYLALRLPRRPDPREAMYSVFERLHDVLDRDLDKNEATWIEGQLAIAKQSDREEIVSLADAIGNYLQAEGRRLATDKPDGWVRIVDRVDALGHRLGRHAHRTIVSALLVLLTLLMVGYIVGIALGSDPDSQLAAWRVPLIAVQSLVAGCMAVGVIAWLRGHEERGLAFSIGGLSLSLVVPPLLHFYLSQFGAITTVLIQLACLQVLMAYRRWHL